MMNQRRYKPTLDHVRAQRLLLPGRVEDYVVLVPIKMDTNSERT